MQILLLNEICRFPTQAVKPMQLEMDVTCLPSEAVVAAEKILISRILISFKEKKIKKKSRL